MALRMGARCMNSHLFKHLHRAPTPCTHSIRARRPASTASTTAKLDESTQSTKIKKMKTLKRSSGTAGMESRAKKRRIELPEYHATPSIRTDSGEIVWPAPEDQIEAARNMILEW